MGKIFYIALPLEVPTRPAASMVVDDWNGKSLHLRCWGHSNLRLPEGTVFHEVVVVWDLQIDFLIGGEVMRPHAAILKVANKLINSISFGYAPFYLCRSNEQLLH